VALCNRHAAEDAHAMAAPQPAVLLLALKEAHAVAAPRPQAIAPVLLHPTQSSTEEKKTRMLWLLHGRW